MEELKIGDGDSVEEISKLSKTIERRMDHVDNEVLNLQRYDDNDATKQLREKQAMEIMEIINCATKLNFERQDQLNFERQQLEQKLSLEQG